MENFRLNIKVNRIPRLFGLIGYKRERINKIIKTAKYRKPSPFNVRGYY
jgi:hypothetical protein